MAWNEVRLDFVKTSWAQGLTCTAIANELNKSEDLNPGGKLYVTRNAVIGVIHRKGWVGGSQPAGGCAMPIRASMKKQGRGTPGRQHPAALAHRIEKHGPMPAAPETAPSVSEATALATTDARRCSLVDLQSGWCKWPVGDPQSPDFFFCGANAADGFCYCAPHARMAYNPVVQHRVKDRPPMWAR